MKIIHTTHDRFKRVEYIGHLSSLISQYESRLLEKYPGLETLHVHIWLNEGMAFTVKQAAIAHQLNEAGNVLEIRIEHMAYGSGLPSQEEFNDKLRRSIEKALA